jgi:ubiquinone/menaquinone biosynthesis C-methylase UbiE
MMNPAEFANIAAAERDLWWYRGMRDILFRLLDPITRARQFDRVLEAGCGTGYLSRLLAERYAWNMVPLDADSDGLQYAREAGTGSLVQGNISGLPFATSSFDALLSIDVIPHLEPGEEHAAFLEFSRVLKPGGVLVLRAAALDLLRSRHSEFVHERQRFTRSHLVDSLELAGFVIDRSTYANSLLLPVALFKFRVWEPLMRHAPQSGVQPVAKWLDQLLHLPLSLEAGWIGSGGSLPIGQSVVLVAHKS